MKAEGFDGREGSETTRVRERGEGKRAGQVNKRAKRILREVDSSESEGLSAERTGCLGGEKPP